MSSPERLELDIAELEQIIVRAALEPADQEKLRAVIETLAFLTRELQNKKTSIHRLRKLIFGASTETLDKIFRKKKPAAEQPESAPADQDGASRNASSQPNDKRKRKGHGRNAAASYEGAQSVSVTHESLQPSQPCSECERGKLYKFKTKPLVRLKGQPLVGGSLYDLQSLRCNLCGKIFTATAPAQAGADKYDASAGAMIAFAKYGNGVPFNRLAKMQAAMGVPLPATTQWDLVHALAKSVAPVHEELIRQAAQGQLLHNDDTPMRVLALMKDNETLPTDDDNTDPKRTGVFTTGIVAINDGRRIALFFTGRQHAGENLADVLVQRAVELNPPLHMCDALSRNLPGKLKTILLNCLAHSRRRYVDVAAHFPEECRHVLEQLAAVYNNDQTAAAQSMSADERLRWHQQHSAPIMTDLEAWLKSQLHEKKVEPNSGLGEAINYMLKHWDKLTRFLHVPGAPLDNNICERALKKAILHRKNALFFKTQNGAHVGDVFMSLIHTAELCGANPCDYLLTLGKHRDQVAANPADWMPWNYCNTRHSLAAHQAA